MLAVTQPRDPPQAVAPKLSTGTSPVLGMTLKAVLFDIEGTLAIGGRPLPGAVEAVALARKAGLAVRFLTNISGRTPAMLCAELRGMGFALSEHEIHTATSACVEYLRERAGTRCRLVVPDAVLPMFDGIARDDEHPDFVVVGDVGSEFDYELLNGVFRQLRDGAELIALHKGVFWIAADGPRLDAGAFIVGLEAATRKQALVMGKPSPVFFTKAFDALGVAPGEALVVGDDVMTDVQGAHGVQARCALVGTGKYRPGDEEREPRPDHFLATLDGFAALLDGSR
jgi:HAD superfamily hydrolase (TIGR01458 family)